MYFRFLQFQTIHFLCYITIPAFYFVVSVALVCSRNVSSPKAFDTVKDCQKALLDLTVLLITRTIKYMN